MIALIDENFELHASKFPSKTDGMKVVSTDNLILVDSGLSCDTFNIIHIKNGAELRYSEIAEAIEYYRTKDFKFCIWVNSENLQGNVKKYLSELSVSKQNEEVGMVMNLNQYETIQTDRHVDIVMVNDANTLNDYANIIASNWSPSDKNVNSYYEKTANCYLKASDQVKLLIYYEGSKPVATVELFQSDSSTIGIYGLATLEDARGKGIGSALMTMCLNQAKELGYKNVVLQASQDGIGIYKKLGFKSLTTYYEFA